jgi:hypothetical protein
VICLFLYIYFLLLDIAEMKDVITKLGGRIPSEPGMTA